MMGRAELARVAGVSENTLVRLERNSKVRVQPATIHRVAEVLRVSPESLYVKD
jgi:transcriptional regulator with XRE-family HTH domain